MPTHRKRTFSPDAKTTLKPLPATVVRQVARAVETLPLHRFLGVKLIRSKPGSGEIRLKAGKSAVNIAGVLHGGVLYALLDAAAYSSVVPLLNEGENAVTHDIHVSVLRPVMLGETIVLKGRVLKRGRTTIFAESEAVVGGKLVATSCVTKSVIRQELKPAR
ncbi:MAG: PaaI family thioesterase [Deltaproteobacteria bacterium]|nr:PaaI family thioesterase [Deltaproteobacteria bacterium]